MGEGMLCDKCGTENRAGANFCRRCGGSLALTCPRCGARHESGDGFCSECGATLGEGAVSARGPAPTPQPPAALHERRLVSILFADLVGFTALSEDRDPEETRDLLTRYFETCRLVISRYGGVIEKFIGDAVMAVWGTPVATEDDAERAVRAALELTHAVAALGTDSGAPNLRARAGVVTGEAAVNLKAQGQGMVAGDVVNTASRTQSVAQPGAVFVDQVTRRATEAAIAFEAAGHFDVKGKSQPLELWRALRVTAGVTGALRASGLEPPFVGRDREIRLLKDLFHAAGENNRAHLLSVTGMPGIGKSRLAWEFEKYVDGIVGRVLWHRGRCLSYGEGVTYWALAEMIKMRARITEEESPESATRKLHDTVAQHVTDEEERLWVEPRVGHLLGLEQRRSFEREELFAGWRLFFVRMADSAPTVLVFEDIQWADASLLDFIEYVLEWSRNLPLFVLTLSRPELANKRPGWGAGKRGFTSLSLEPLGESDLDELLSGLVPGLERERRVRIARRSEGIPLYAVETVRMLIDMGVLQKRGHDYVATGSMDDIHVPESLHALIAARLDGLDEPQRRLLQDAAVAGKSFTPHALGALNGGAQQDLGALLDALVAKDLLTVQADPMSPERGQYSFLQELVRQVSYDTLSKKQRKARHLAMATYLEDSSGFDNDEVVEVLSSHYIDAYSAAPTASDAPEIKRKAMEALTGAAHRAASLGANEEAQRYFQQATELTDDPTTKAELLEGAGQAATMGARMEAATALYGASIDLFESTGLTHKGARVRARLGDVMSRTDRQAEARRLLTESLDLLAQDEPDEAIGAIANSLARNCYFGGDVDSAAQHVELALEVAEKQGLPELLASALTTKSFVLDARGRRAEGLAVLKHSLDIALENDITSEATRAYANLTHQMQTRDRYDEAIDYGRLLLSLVRRIGDRQRELESLLADGFSLFVTGEWDEALRRADEIPDRDKQSNYVLASLMVLTWVLVNRGDLTAAGALLRDCMPLRDSPDVQVRAMFWAAQACVRRAEVDLTACIDAARAALEARSQEGWGAEFVKAAFVEAVEAALSLGDVATVEELLSLVKAARPVEVPLFVHAHVARFRARLEARAGNSIDAEAGFKAAAGMFREMGASVYLAVTLMEHGEWLTDQDRATESAPLLGEARAIFERLEAGPWLERLDRSASVSAR